MNPITNQLALILTPLVELWPAVEEGDSSADGGGGSMWDLLIPTALILVIFYVLLILPEKKKQRQRDDMLGGMKKGDRVMTTSGIFASVVQLKEEEITLQVADGVRMRFHRSAVQQVVDPKESKDKQDAKPNKDNEA